MTEPLRAIAFDAYGTLFDVYCMEQLAEQLFPHYGERLTRLWRDKQIEYGRIRSLSGQYRNFWEVTRDALDYAARALELEMDDSARQHLMNQYACLNPFPENLAALHALKSLGLPLAILSNGTHAMLDIAVKYCGMKGLFEHILSADSVQRFKTAPEVYQLAPTAFSCPASQILFVSGNAWDAWAGAWFGFTSFWLNRNGQPDEVLEGGPAGRGTTLNDVVDFVKGRLI